MEEEHSHCFVRPQSSDGVTFHSEDDDDDGLLSSLGVAESASHLPAQVFILRSIEDEDDDFEVASLRMRFGSEKQEEEEDADPQQRQSHSIESPKAESEGWGRASADFTFKPDNLHEDVD